MMKKWIAAGAALIALTTPVLAQVKVGVIVGATGPGAGLGIPYKNTFAILPKSLGGQAVEYVVRDDATDPTNGVKFARDLIVGDKVDLLIGSTSVPSSIAISDVAAQLKAPQIALAAVGAAVSKNPWLFAIVQPADLMMGAVAADMKASDYGYVLETGAIVLAEPSEELAHDPRVEATYLGGTGRSLH
jgi:branched-chain amino acid transport system substrate-binding protein